MANMSGPLCGDVTCEAPGCTQEAIDNWQRDRTADAKVLVRPWAICDNCKIHEHERCTAPETKGWCCCEE